MSWTTVFPVLTDEMLEQYEADSTDVEKAELAAWFSVKEVINAQPQARHVVSTSLFWKHPRKDDPDLPKLDRKTLKQAKKRGLVRRFDPWSHYVQPLLDGARQILKDRSDLAVRVYLAGDLDFLVKDLVTAGCEVRLMHSSSLRHNPGAMWRFLAFEEKNCLITMTDSDRLPLAGPDILRTEEMAKSGLGLWRVPVWGDLASDGTVPYRPMFGGQFGGRLKLPMRRLMKAFVWHNRRGTISAKCQIPACGERPINGGAWPEYGFDEYFLIAAVYPRAARKGVLSFIPSNARSQLLPLDIEYVTWCNPRSEVVYFGAAGCCTPAELPAQAAITAAPEGLMRVDDFTLLDTEDLTQRHPLPPSARRLRSEKDEINGSVWAWFNPASVLWRGQRWLTYRTECSPRWHWSRISVARLDDAGGVIAGSNKLLNLPTDFGKWGAEDPRLTVWQDRLFLSYCDGWKTAIAELDENGDILKARIFREKKIVESIAFEKDQREKNWGLFGTDDGLFVSYWMAPHIVFRYDERRGKLGEHWQTAWTAPVETGQLHGGSSPVLHAGLFWRVVHSQAGAQGGPRVYRLWLMAFSARPPFEPLLFCKKPLVIAEPEKAPIAEQVPHDVVFCGSAERTPDGWLIFFGENDRRIRYGVIPDALLSPHFVSVGAIGG